MNKCSFCRSWNKTKSITRNRQYIYVGECRKHTPIVEKEFNYYGIWPITYEDDWCGEFEIEIRKTKDE